MLLELAQVQTSGSTPLTFETNLKLFGEGS